MSSLEQSFSVERFEYGDIEADLFDHEAHVYVAWLFDTKFDLAEAVTRFESGLRRLTRKLGVPNKYHATITWFFMLLIAERSRTNEDWSAFKARNPDLISQSETTLGRYYSKARLFSDTARNQFVLPDRVPA